jgi:hypothetical protein
MTVDHELTIVKVVPMDASSLVYWTCSCGAVGDEDWNTPADASSHYYSAHLSN